MAESTPEQWYRSLPAVTRVGLTAAFATTVLVQLEILDPGLILLHWPLIVNKMQVWRLLTPVCFCGTFSMSWMMQMYMFCSFSARLEQNEAFAIPGDYLFFVIVQALLLAVLSLMLAWPTGFPMLGPSFVFAILYYWSRREPYALMSFFGFAIKGYQMPFFLMLFQLLLGGDIWLDLLGLASGHAYYFLREVLPQEYGLVLVKTPSFLRRLAAGGGSGRARPAPPRPFVGGGYRLGTH